MLVMALTLLRLLWVVVRLAKPSFDVPKWMHITSKATQGILWLLTLAVPVSALLTLGNVIIWVSGLHAVAAIFHHLVMKDGVLLSMLPPRDGGPATRDQGVSLARRASAKAKTHTWELPLTWETPGFNSMRAVSSHKKLRMPTSITYTMPPGPPSRMWGANHLRHIQHDFLSFISQLQRQYTDIAYLRVLNEEFVHVFHPDWVREVLVDQAHALIRWEHATEVFRMSMGQSVLVTEGSQWQRQRRMLQPGFTPKRVASYAYLMAQATHEALDPLTDQRCVNIDALMTRVTLDVILRTLFGQHQVKDPQPVSDAIQTLSHFGLTQILRPFKWPLWLPVPSVWRARAAIHTLNTLIDQHIELQQTLAQDGGDDLLSMLRLARDPDHPEQGLSPQELHDQTMVMFQAGHETTATALTWWCGLIAQHPEVAQRIHHEVETVLQGQDPTPATLAQMPWLQASLKEAMRLYPPAAILFSRRACQDIRIGPWLIPKGHLISICPSVIQRDPRWFESPDAFRPERFLPDAPDLQRGAWMPFGIGPRVCIGQHFAMLEMGLIAAMLMQRFALKWPQGQAWPKGQMAISLRPATPMVLHLEARPSMRV
jgi:cytochrome P450